MLYMLSHEDTKLAIIDIYKNTDRHMNNFGIIRDSKTLKWLHMAPIFDSGNSMFYDSMSIPSGNELLKIRVNSFANIETKLYHTFKTEV